MPTLPLTIISLLTPLDYIGDRSCSHSPKMEESKAILRIAQGLLRTTKVARKQVLGSESTEPAGDSRGQSDLAQAKEIKIKAITITDIY